MTDLRSDAMEDETRIEAPATHPAADADDSRSESWSGELVTLCALVAAVAVGQALFFRTPAVLTLGPLAGMVAGLGSRRWWSAGAVAALGTVVGAFLATILGTLRLGDAAMWIPAALPTAAAAAVVGALVVTAIRMRAQSRRAFVVIALLWIIGTMVASGIAFASIPTPAGQTSIGRMSQAPTFSKTMSDEDMFYLSWVFHLRAGESYYPMEVRSFAEVGAVQGSASLVRIRSPFSYRPPTLYVLLAALPPNGLSFVIAMMAVCSIAVVAGYFLARQFLMPPVALVAALFVATACSGYGSVLLLQAEAWAGVFAMASVTAFVVSRQRSESRGWLQVLAVGFALAATAFREIAVPLLVLGLIATLVDPEERAKRAWAIWAGALAVAAVAIAAHWFAASLAFASATPQPVSSTWFHPNGAGLVGAMFLFANSVSLVFFPTVALLLVLGMIGSATAPKDWPSRVMLAGVAIGGPLVLMVVHPPGWTSSHTAPGYWGFIFWPTVMACAPLAFARISAASRKHESAND